VACLLLLKQPDMGTALVICFATFCLLVASGARMRHLGIIVGALVLLVIVVAAFGMRREQAQHPAGAQSLAVLLIVVVAALVLSYLVLHRRG